MADRQRVTVPFGKSLDRETGFMAAKPGAMEDLRNVYLRRGKLVVRKGVDSKLTLTDTNGDPLTHILAGQAIRGLRIGLIVGYQGDDTAGDAGKVFIYRIDADASTVDQLQYGSDPANPQWFTVSNPATAPVPTIITAEANSNAFFAHDRFSQTDREPTLVYDPYTGPDLQTLDHDFIQRTDDEGNVTSEPKPLRFRGVVSHLDYLFGWGYGTQEESNRPEILRVSLPGAPQQFDPNHYFIIGSRKDPIVTAKPASSSTSRLVVLKENELHAVEGSGRHNFGSIERDSRFGCIGSRLAISVRGRVLFWSVDGPRVTTGGGPSEMASVPLELKGFEPADLPDPGNLEEGFAEYIPEEQVALWVFGQRCYALNLRGDARGWTYWELGFEPECAFTLYGAEAGSQGTTQPSGHADFGAYGAQAADETTMDLVYTDESVDGDEFAEIWRREVANMAWPEALFEPTGSGAADGWTDGGALTYTPTLDDGDGDGTDDRQKIEVTGGASGDQAYVEKIVTGASAGTEYRISAHHLVENLTDLEGRIEVAFLASDDTVLQDSDFVASLGAATDGGRRAEVVATAPTSTAKIRVRLILEANGASPSGTIYWKRVLIMDPDASGDWFRADAVSVNPSEHTVTVGGNKHGWFYEFAIRHTRSNKEPTNYQVDDPDQWPAVSKALGKLPNALPVMEEVAWERTSGSEEVAYATLTINAPHEHDILVDASSERTIAAGNEGTRTEEFKNNTSVSEITGETRHDFTPRVIHPDGIQQVEGTGYLRWMGPVRPEIHQFYPGTDQGTVYFFIQEGAEDAGKVSDSDCKTELADNIDGYTVDTTTNEGDQTGVVTYATQNSGDPVSVKARHLVTQYEKTDRSDWSDIVTADVGSGGL